MFSYLDVRKEGFMKIMHRHIFFRFNENYGCCGSGNSKNILFHICTCMFKEHLCAYVISSDWDCNDSCDLVKIGFLLMKLINRGSYTGDHFI